MLRLNLGCGARKLADWVNVDISDHSNPDLVWDLEQTPWPWQNDSVVEIELNHVLEHLGESSRNFLAIMRELYRVCASGAVIHIKVPHPRHDNFINDPTHVRAITPEMLCLFDKEWNRHWAELGAANTPLAVILDVDFFIENVSYLRDPHWQEQLAAGTRTEAEFQAAARCENNVIAETAIDLVVRKPAGH